MITVAGRAFAAAIALSFVTAVAAEPAVERSTMLLLGNHAGFQEARYAGDGSVKVHYEFNDRGRGPKLDAEYGIGEGGLPERFAIKGVAYLKTPVDESFTRDASGARWKNASEDEARPAGTPGYYIPLETTPEDSAILARALL